MQIIAALVWQDKVAFEGGASVQLNHVAAGRARENLLEILPRTYSPGFSVSRSIS
jgi:hypothetical protein